MKIELEQGDKAIESTCLGCVFSVAALVLFMVVVAAAFSPWGFGIVFRH